MALQLNPLVSDPVPSQQLEFIQGRSIIEGLVTTSKCINMTDHMAFGDHIAIKLDMNKAVDTISWEFLLQVLQIFGFNEKFLAWVHTVLKSARLSVFINGAPMVSFLAQGGKTG